MRKILSWVTIMVAAVMIGLGLDYALADWTPAPDSPPSGNVAAPINVGGSSQAKLGGLSLGTTTPPSGNLVADIEGGLFAQSILTQGFTLDDGEASAINEQGYVLTNDGTGRASWQPVGSGAGVQSCPESQYVTGFDASGHIICDYIAPMAMVAVNTDEQVLIHLSGTNVTATNWTRGGGAITSYSFANAINGMPKDGRALKLYNLVSSNGNAVIVSPCPAGWMPGNNGLSDEMCIYQQPSAGNGYETIVAIWDGAAGTHSWTFDLDYAD